MAGRRRHQPSRCLPKDGSARLAKHKPKSCTTLGPNDAFANAANLAKLRWKGWGTAKATATGIEKGFHLPYSHIKVKSRHGTLTQTIPAVCSG